MKVQYRKAVYCENFNFHFSYNFRRQIAPCRTNEIKPEKKEKTRNDFATLIAKFGSRSEN